jgi:hypothetical protein
MAGDLLRSRLKDEVMRGEAEGLYVQAASGRGTRARATKRSLAPSLFIATYSLRDDKARIIKSIRQRYSLFTSFQLSDKSSRCRYQSRRKVSFHCSCRSCSPHFGRRSRSGRSRHLVASNFRHPFQPRCLPTYNVTTPSHRIVTLSVTSSNSSSYRVYPTEDAAD